MKSIGTLLACLLASITWSHGQTNGGYTNFIRQKQLPSGVEWDMTVAAAGESQSALAINPGGAQFELWSINTVTAAEYVLDSRYVGSYVPIGGVVRPDLAVLHTSGYTENAIVHHGRLDPGVLLLGKPYLRAELADKLRQALARRPTLDR